MIFFTFGQKTLHTVQRPAHTRVPPALRPGPLTSGGTLEAAECCSAGSGILVWERGGRGGEASGACCDFLVSR